jgi:hypothetical protein
MQTKYKDNAPVMQITVRSKASIHAGVRRVAYNNADNAELKAPFYFYVIH